MGKIYQIFKSDLIFLIIYKIFTLTINKSNAYNSHTRKIPFQMIHAHLFY